MRELIVDGYNVVHSLPCLKKSQTLELARDRLIEILRGYADSSGVSVTVVFDGAKDSESVLQGTPKVIFTKSSQSADSCIEQIVHSAINRADICVVTNDSLHQQLVFGMGGFYMSTKAFADEIENKVGELNEWITKHREGLSD